MSFSCSRKWITSPPASGGLRMLFGGSDRGQDDLIDQFLQDPSSLLSNNDKKEQPVMENTKSARWKSFDWKAENLHNNHRRLCVESEQLTASPVDTILLNGYRAVYVKRDDRLLLEGSHVSGNKARKFLALNEMDESNFPRCVVSYGGPQSNAMVALAAIVNFRNQEQESRRKALEGADRYRFVYYTKRLPRFLRNNPSGNLFRATALGMELVELPSHQDYNELFGSGWGGKSEPPLALEPPIPGDSLWVPQGGACGIALAGTWRLAQEVLEFWKKSGHGRPLSLCMPGGTCSTALLLHHAIQELNAEYCLDIRVVVVPCVGDELYSQRQMMGLNVNLGYPKENVPTVLLPNPPTDYKPTKNLQDSKTLDKYFLFGEPHEQLLETYNFMKDEHDLVLDLLYGAPSWTIMLRHLTASQRPFSSKTEQSLSFDPRAPLSGRSVMYIHSGGLEGIGTQLLRYRYKGLVGGEEVQVPQKPAPKSQADKFFL
ncbi:hypothetical protein ACA910_009155 [Epithemia clementina (nom. ined.)]